MRSLCLALLVFTLLPDSSRGQAADYEIRLHRPGKAGERYRVTAVGRDTKTSTTTSEGRTPRLNRYELGVELEGTVTILEVAAAGVRKAEIRIERAARDENGKRAELLPAGTIVTELRRGASQVFEVKGQPLPADTGEALGLVLSETSVENDDELFGSSRRRKLGERWSVDPAGVAALFSRPSGGRRMAVTARDVTGSVRLDRIAFSGLLPLDPARPRLQESARVTVRFRGRRFATADNPAMTLEASLEKRTSRSLTPLD
jgi:hypothetical protein